MPKRKTSTEAESRGERRRFLRSYAMTEVCKRRTTEPATCAPGAQLYRHFNEWGELLYVGVSLSAAVRLGGHRNTSGWFSEIAFITIEHFDTREDALIAEEIAIQKEDPIYNLGFPDFAVESV